MQNDKKNFNNYDLSKSPFREIQRASFLSVTHPSAAVVTDLAYFNNIPFSAFRAGLFQFFFLSLIIFSSTLRFIDLVDTFISIISLSSTNASNPPSKASGVI